MQDETEAARQPRTKPFRRPFTTVRLAPDVVQRQGQITAYAFLALGRDRALGFMNVGDTSLGGRPLDVAMASVEGQRKVEALIDMLAIDPAGAVSATS